MVKRYSLEVKKFDLILDRAQMVKVVDGNYVLHEDYKRLQEHVDALEALLAHRMDVIDDLMSDLSTARNE